LAAGLAGHFFYFWPDMKLGILKETREPKDNRTPLTPSQCAILKEENPDMQVYVQPCNFRCYTNDEYRYHGIELCDDLSHCDVLMGVKEIPPHLLIPDKTYFIFSHTIKKQPANRQLLKTVLEKNITLIDWETLVDANGKRLIAFGRWAGIVGAYHALRMAGTKYQLFHMRQMSECHNFAEAQDELQLAKLPPLKIVLTGTGRVSNGAAFLLNLAHIKRVSPHQFCYSQFDEPVYTQLTSADMYYRDGYDSFDPADYHLHPQLYQSAFYPFTKVADIMINGIYWDERIPVFFTKEQMQEKDFRINIIADITCDIMPGASIPATLQPSSISNPYYGYNALTGKVTEAFGSGVVDMMAIDNLPNELPRDASEDFGNMLTSRIIPELKKADSAIIYRATIARAGKLNAPYTYLNDYVI
jgi:saccharopine dehydrogenase (NAD+, L-lysine forming)